MGKKYCVVPLCKNTSMSAPNKLFIATPRNPTLRLKWWKAMKREPLSPNSREHICEDHFILEQDLENYTRLKLMGGFPRLKKGIVPHIFECHKNLKPPPQKSRSLQSFKPIAPLLKPQNAVAVPPALYAVSNVICVYATPTKLQQEQQVEPLSSAEDNASAEIDTAENHRDVDSQDTNLLADVKEEALTVEDEMNIETCFGRLADVTSRLSKAAERIASALEIISENSKLFT